MCFKNGVNGRDTSSLCGVGRDPLNEYDGETGERGSELERGGKKSD